MTSFALPESPTGTPIDPGPPPRLGDPATDAEFKQAALEVLRYSSQLDPADGVEIDRAAIAMRVHFGTEDQEPDALILAKQGGHAPAYRGLAYDAETLLDPMMSVIVLATGGTVALGLAVALFSWDRKNATRRVHPAVALLAIVPYLVGTFLA